MKVNETKEVGGVDPVASQAERQSAAARPRADKVSIQDAHRVKEAVSSAQLNAGPSRAGRLRELESAIRGGNYRPDTARLAEQLLAAAEVDARIRAMLQG